MAQAKTEVQGPEFSGSKAEKELATRVFQAFQLSGRFFAIDTPITLSADSLLEFLEQSGESVKPDVLLKAVRANETVFSVREDEDGAISIVSNRRGVAPDLGDGQAEDKHDLRERFSEPEPVRPQASAARSERSAARTGSESPAGATRSEFAPDSWQAAVAAALAEAGEETDEIPAVRIVDVPEEERVEIGDEDIAVQITETETESGVEADAEVVDVAEPEAVEEEVEEEIFIDVVSATDDELASAIEQALVETDELVRWGDTWMAESSVGRLSRGDVRKLQEFLGESDEPLSDVDLVQDLRGVMPGSDEFEGERFALNYRMAQETKDFEFVGTAGSALWSSTALKPIGSDKRKASDIGHDYDFLNQYQDRSPAAEEGIVEHVLTLYEFRLGVLPYNGDFAALLPRAAFDNQRATRLTFESPQTLESFEIELRYPTENRGGYLIGFEQFFAENLVPGAVLTIEQADSETSFIIEYFQMSRQDRKLLQLDDRKHKFVFKQTTYYCAIQDDMLLDDNHFERLNNVEPLSEAVRRQPEQVVAATFERIGEVAESGDKKTYIATFTDLLAVANIERPISADYLRDILETPSFRAGDEEDVYVYESD